MNSNSTRKKIKMLVYGEPGVGKSVFASQFPKPFFITTDGNYEWLEDFGADPDAHVRVNSYEEAVCIIDENIAGYEKLANIKLSERTKTLFTESQTIVVDLFEDLFKWCEFEYVNKNKLDHVSDVGYGKGYDITRNNFFVEMTKLINKPKHIIFLMHGVSFEVKDRRGVPHTSYRPSTRLPDKVLDMIEGRLRFVLRAYFQDVEVNGKLRQKRMLSLIPKSNEYGIIRGVNTDALPEDIPLSAAEFFNVLDNYKVEFTKERIYETPKANAQEQKTSKRIRSQKTETPVSNTSEVVQEKPVNSESEIVQAVNEGITEDTSTNEVIKEETKTPAVQDAEKATDEQAKVSKEDKLAAIKAKLAALKKQ